MRTRDQVRSFLHVSRTLDPAVRASVRRYVAWAREEVGDVPTSGQLGLLAALRLSLTVILLAERDMSRAETPAPALIKTLNAYLTTFRHTVTVLGLLQRKGQGPAGGRKKPPEMDEVVESYERKVCLPEGRKRRGR